MFERQPQIQRIYDKRINKIPSKSYTRSINRSKTSSIILLDEREKSTTSSLDIRKRHRVEIQKIFPKRTHTIQTPKGIYKTAARNALRKKLLQIICTVDADTGEEDPLFEEVCAEASDAQASTTASVPTPTAEVQTNSNSKTKISTLSHYKTQVRLYSKEETIHY